MATRGRNIDDEITALLAECEPLRKRPETDPGQTRLQALIEKINALRAVQESATRGIDAGIAERDTEQFEEAAKSVTPLARHSRKE